MALWCDAPKGNHHHCKQIKRPKPSFCFSDLLNNKQTKTRNHDEQFECMEGVTFSSELSNIIVRKKPIEQTVACDSLSPCPSVCHIVKEVHSS
jgi:hypothetical protein